MSTYIIAAVMVIIAVILKQTQVKGWIGEKGVSRRLKKLDPKDYQVYNDVTLPSGNGRTTQIDHIVADPGYRGASERCHPSSGVMELFRFLSVSSMD